MIRVVTFFTAIGFLSGCATRDAMHAPDLETGRQPPPNITVRIPGLGPCTDNPDRSLRFDASQPLNILVHGCYSSSGEFRALAQVFAFHGQQSACFTYDDRARLAQSATELRTAIEQLAARSRLPQVTVIGHSQGALIARGSLTETTRTPHHLDLRLVTISGPFSGIESARTCGHSWLYPLTLGLLPLSCHIATGPKWTDITYSSRFIREPASLAEQVASYLKIDTDERGTCRREQGGRCIEDDDIFSLAEQRNAIVESDPRVRRVEVHAGHVEIVGDQQVAPTKLIAILQAQGIIRPTAPERASAFDGLLARIYGLVRR